MANVKSRSNLGLPIGGKTIQGELVAYDDGTAKWTYLPDKQFMGDYSTFTLKNKDGKWDWSGTTTNSLQNLATRESLTFDQVEKSLYSTPQVQTILNGQTVNLLGGIEEARKIDPNYPGTQGVATTPNVPIDQQLQVGTEEQKNIEFLNQTFGNNDIKSKELNKEFFKGPYVYPQSIRNNGQDYIQFTICEYGTKSINPPTNQSSENISDLFELSSRKFEELGDVFLPIQQGISDQNMVSWADENMSPLAVALMKSAANPNAIGGSLTGISEEISNNQTYQKMIQQQLYGAAAGINPLARLSGLVVNPNLELLFNGPTLRPFNFTFRLSPRNAEEAKQVKNIIRWFKQGSVVRTTNDNLFLKAPCVFKIQYVYGESKNAEKHPGLNKIKTCALRSMNVNYNPDGSYMTFEDGTMTSYEMTLQFSELEPIYDIDYDDTPDNSIGY